MKKQLIAIVSLTLLLGATGVAEAAAPEAKCKACHTFEQGGKNKMGPNLFGIVGRKAGSLEDFKYASYLKDADFTWDEETLLAWVNDSKGIAKAAGKKTKMPAQHVKGDQGKAVVEFLKTLK